MLELFHTLARYNRWMNEKIYEVCESMPDATRREDRGAFFGSVHGTLNHLLLADRVWLGRFRGEPFVVQSLGQELYADWVELREARCATDDAIEAWIATVAEAELQQPFEYVSIVDPQPRRLELWKVVLHFFNHQTHHRGQLTTLMNQLGYDSGVTDLLWLPGVQMAPAQSTLDAATTPPPT